MIVRAGAVRDRQQGSAPQRRLRRGSMLVREDGATCRAVVAPGQ